MENLCNKWPDWPSSKSSKRNSETLLIKERKENFVVLLRVRDFEECEREIEIYLSYASSKI
jgi:hypothetical protein